MSIAGIFGRSVPLWVRGAVLLAVLIFVAVSLFGIDMPMQWGHYGFHLGEYTLRARGTLRFLTPIPAHWGGVTFPPVSSYYLHHPILAHQFLTLGFLALGDHLWVARAVAAGWGLVNLLLLARLVVRNWGPLPGALAALSFAIVPFNWAFGIHYDPGHLTTMGFLLAMNGWLDHLERPRRATALLMIAGFALGGLSEWSAYFYTTVFVPIALLWRGNPGVAGTVQRLSARWIVFACGLTMVAALGFHFWFTYHVGALDDLLLSYSERRFPTTWEQTRTMQSKWLWMYLGPVYLALIGLWAAALVVRAFLGKIKPRDLLGITLLGGWALYLAIFSDGLNIHSYRVMPLAVLAALAVATLAVDLSDVLRWVGARLSLRPLGEPVAQSTGGVLLLAALAGSVPHSVDTLLDARALAGTAEFEGYHPHLEQFLFAQTVQARTPRDALVIAHENMGARIEFVALVDRELGTTATLYAGLTAPMSRRVVVVWDLLSLDDLDAWPAALLIDRHGALLVDQFAMVDLGSTDRRIEAYVTEPGPMTLSHRLFVSWKHPPLRVRPAVLPGLGGWLATLSTPFAADDVTMPHAIDDVRGIAHVHDALVAQNQHASLSWLEDLMAQRPAYGVQLGPVRVMGWEIEGQTLRVMVAPDADLGDRQQFFVVFRTAEGLERVALLPWLEHQQTELWRQGYWYVVEARLEQPLAPGWVVAEAYPPMAMPALNEPASDAGAWGAEAPGAMARAVLGRLAPDQTARKFE